METQTQTREEQFQELVREEWSDPATVEGWRRWFPKMLEQFRTGTDLLVRTADLRPGMHVLDLASGSGDPAIALAEAVGTSGRVTATDGSAEMLALAEDHARERGLDYLTFEVADAQALPFGDASFDRVTSKLGVMYFVDCGRALQEIRRVLKPGGKIALLAWGAPDQSPYIQTALGPVLARAQRPAPPPDAPQPFRFGRSGSLSEELDRAGFRQIEEATHVIPLAWPGPPEELWQHLYDIAAPFRPVVDGLDPDAREEAIDEVLSGLRRYYDGERTTTPASVVVASGVR